MQVKFKVRNRDVQLTQLDDAIAIRSSPKVSETVTRAEVMKLFATSAASDDSSGGRFGMTLPASGRKLFEKAGWSFVEPRENLVAAASTRKSVDNGGAARSVFVDRGGNTLIATERFTIQFPPDAGKDERKATFDKHRQTVQGKARWFGSSTSRRLPPDCQRFREDRIPNALQGKGRNNRGSHRCASGAYSAYLKGLRFPARAEGGGSLSLDSSERAEYAHVSELTVNNLAKTENV